MTEPVRYLSDEWLRRADEALAGLAPLPVPLRVGFVITGGSGGDSTHQLVLGPDRVGAERGVEGTQVTLTMTWALAVDIAQGSCSAQRAFLDGTVQLGGDAGVLLGHQAALAEVDDRLATLRNSTLFR